jgi:hypothetical protein
MKAAFEHQPALSGRSRHPSSASGGQAAVRGPDRDRSVAGRHADQTRPAPARAAQVVVKAATTGNPWPSYLIGPHAHAAAAVAQLPHRLRYRLTAAKR